MVDSALILEALHRDKGRTAREVADVLGLAAAKPVREELKRMHARVVVRRLEAGWTATCISGAEKWVRCDVEQAVRTVEDAVPQAEEV